MKFLKIGKRVLIGVTLLATGLFVAYRIGTYHQDIIEYNNVLVKDIVKSELESAIQTVDDVDIGLNVKEAQSGSQIVAEVQNLSSTEEEEHGEVKVAVATKPTEKTSKTSSNKSNKTTSSSNKVTSSKNNSTTNKNTSSSTNKNNSNSNKPTTTDKNTSSSNSTNNKNNSSSSNSNKNNSNSSSDNDIKVNVDGTYRDDISSQLRDLINVYRESLGLKKLSYDSSLQSYADTRVKEITVKFSHTRPNGQYAVGGSKYKSEIIASGNSARATLVVNSWKKSSAHNNIMTDSQYTKFAISSFCVGNKYYYVVIFS